MDGQGAWREDARNEEPTGVVAWQEFIESLTTASMPSQSNQQEMVKKKTDNRTEHKKYELQSRQPRFAPAQRREALRHS
jgi:hypothetical protein